MRIDEPAELPPRVERAVVSQILVDVGQMAAARIDDVRDGIAELVTQVKEKESSTPYFGVGSIVFVVDFQKVGANAIEPKVGNVPTADGEHRDARNARKP